jgi:hypothetical protein
MTLILMTQEIKLSGLSIKKDFLLNLFISSVRALIENETVDLDIDGRPRWIYSIKYRT